MCQCVLKHEREGREGEFQALNKLYTNVVKIWEEIVCPKGQYDEWHHQECLLGNCSLCGVDSLEFCPCKENVDM